MEIVEHLYFQLQYRALMYECVWVNNSFYYNDIEQYDYCLFEALMKSVVSTLDSKPK